MILLLLIGLCLAGGAVALVFRVFAMNRMRTDQTIGQIEAYGFSRPTAAEKPSSLRGLFDELAGAVGGLLAAKAGGTRAAQIRLELMSAGLYTLSPRKFHGYRMLCAISMPVVWAATGSVAGFAPGIYFLGIPLTMYLGWKGPLLVVRSRARRRFDEIEYELPELIDLLVVTVEAGMGFNGSLRIAAERLEGPLGNELRLTLQEQNMGLGSTEALKNMLARCQSPGMRSFVRSIVQGEQLGVSIGQIMRDLAVDMRKRRRQAAEEKSHKAPIKILFPLVFLIFPAMFVILLAPAVYSFLDAF